MTRYFNEHQTTVHDRGRDRVIRAGRCRYELEQPRLTNVRQRDNVAVDANKNTIDQRLRVCGRSDNREGKCQEESLAQNASPKLRWNSHPRSRLPAMICRSVLKPKSSRSGPSGESMRNPKPTAVRR